MHITYGRSVRHADAGYFDPCQLFEKSLISGRKIETSGRKSKMAGSRERHPGHAFSGYQVVRVQATRPWQCLYFLPEPHGHIALRGVRGSISSAEPAMDGATRRTMPSGSASPSGGPPTAASAGS